MVELTPSHWRNPSFTASQTSMSHGLECRQVCVPPGARSQFAEQAAMALNVKHTGPLVQGHSRPPDLRVCY
jgi:hypothetical protein